MFDKFIEMYKTDKLKFFSILLFYIAIALVSETLADWLAQTAIVDEIVTIVIGGIAFYVIEKWIKIERFF